MSGNVRLDKRMYIFLIVLLVLFFVCFLSSFIIEGIKQKKIISIRRLLNDMPVKEQYGDGNFSETEPLLLDACTLKQMNDGPDLQNENFKTIKVRSYGSECELVSLEKGIWW